nr:T-complex protein gamma SU [Cryptomonas paramecium]
MNFKSDTMYEYNTNGAKAIANIIKTTFGPRSMLKMIIDNQGNLIVTNDGYSVLREVETFHPIIKSLVEISKVQDNEVGDGTTSIVLLCTEFLKAAEILIKKKLHPNQIIGGYFKVLNSITSYIDKNFAFSIKKHDFVDILKIISTSICTKFVGRYSRLICEIAFKAVYSLNADLKNLGIGQNIKIEKIFGNKIENSRVLSGIIIPKDVCHPKMRRFISNPKILLLECSVDFKKTDFKSIVNIKNELKLQNILKTEENYTIYFCNIIKKFQPDILITEKNVSDFALYYLFKSNISVIRRVKKSDNNRLAKATGSTIVSNIEEIDISDIGSAKNFCVKKIGDVCYTFITGCKNYSACTILLFGLSKDVLDEIERNLHDAIGIVKLILQKPSILPGGGGTELELCKFLSEKKFTKNDSFLLYNSICSGLEIIPKTLVENCGMFSLHTIHKLKKIHFLKGSFYGIEGKYGKICDTRKLGIIEPSYMKIQIFKKAIENAAMIIRIDKFFYGLSQQKI